MLRMAAAARPEAETAAEAPEHPAAAPRFEEGIAEGAPAYPAAAGRPAARRSIMRQGKRSLIDDSSRTPRWFQLPPRTETPAEPGRCSNVRFLTIVPHCSRPAHCGARGTVSNFRHVARRGRRRAGQARRSAPEAAHGAFWVTFFRLAGIPMCKVEASGRPTAPEKLKWHCALACAQSPRNRVIQITSPGRFWANCPKSVTQVFETK